MLFHSKFYFENRGESKGMQEKVSIMGNCHSGSLSSASLVMPISDPRDRFFYPYHTHMKDTYIIGQRAEKKKR